MMNDAMMQMKSRHNNISSHLTGLARRALLLFALLFVGGSGACGQVTLISSGVIDSNHEGDYATIKSNYPINVSSLVPDITTWSGYNDSRAGQHWDGSSTSTYFDHWDGSSLIRTNHFKEMTLSLPKGKYTLMAAGRGSTNVATVYLKVGDYEVSMVGKGDSGKGITTTGEVSFSDGSFALDGNGQENGRGWQYLYIQFEVTGDGTNVRLEVSGSSSGAAWLSFCTPMLFTESTTDNGSFDMGKAYTLELYNTGKYMNLTDVGAIITSTPQPLYLVKAFGDGMYYLTDGRHYLGTSDNINLSTSAPGNPFKVNDISWFAEGQYTLSYTNGESFVGTDSQDDNASCRANRRQTEGSDQGYNNLWKIVSTTFPGTLLSHTQQTIEVPVEMQGRYSKTVTELSDDYNAIVTGLSVEGTLLTANMLKIANGFGASATQGGDASCEYVLNSSTSQPYGDPGVNNYADLSGYSKLVVTVTEGTPRFLFNRDVDGGQWNADESQSHLIDNTSGGWSAKYFTQEGNVYTVNLQKMMADKGYVHLHAIKSTGGNVTVESMTLYGTPLTTADMHRYNSWTNSNDGISSTGTYNYILGRSTDQPYGDPAVNAYVDLSAYKKLVVTMSSGTPRFMFNRDADNGQWNENETQSHLIEYPKDGWINRYFTKEGNTYIVDLEKMVNDKGYAHLHAIKGANWQNVTMERIELYGAPTGNVYARLFVADKTSGEQVADQSVLTIAPPAGWTQKNINSTDYGYIYYGDVSSLKAALNGITVSSSTPLYSGNNTLSLVISSDMTRLNPTNATSASAIVAEPNWEKQYLLDFYKVDEFVGNLKGDGIAIREAVELADANVMSAQLTKLAATYSQIAGKVNTQDKVYARLFASDDAGNALDDQSVLSFGDLTSKGWTWKEGYGWIYYGNGFSENLLQGITVSSSMALPSTGAQVGLVVSSDMARLTPTSPGSVAAITKEPNWEVLYLNHFTYPFAGTVKDKFFRHSREILLTSSEVSAGRTEIPLNEALDRIKSEYERSNVTAGNNTGLGTNLHIRWFVTYDGEMIANSESYLAPIVNSLGHQTKTSYGIYWNSAAGGVYPLTTSSDGNSSETRNWLNMTFTKPDYGDWGKYKVVIWMSDDTSADNGQTQDGSVLTHEPDINMVYYYSFFVEDEFRFVHSKGAAVEAYPDLPYLIKSSSVQQYDWDNVTSSIVASADGDTRQDVHTVIYDIYMKPSDGKKALKLPFERYFEDEGNDLEPNAYIRWYDWESDLGSDKLTAVGTWLEKLTDSDTGNSRGLFALNRDLNNQKPTHSMVGVTYDPTNLSDTHIIACDVSKYYDGIYRSSIADIRPGFEGLYKPYMLHEPTLSIRYLFRIHPASLVAAAINAGHSSWITGVQGTNGVGGLENGASLKDVKSQLFDNIFEDNGRVVVSLNGSNGTFSLRAGLASLDNYFINSGNTQCDHITWRAYLEDAQGLWRRDGAVFTNRTTRTQAFTLSDISGDYILFSDAPNDQEPRKNGLTAAPGMRFHILGFVGGNSGDEQAAIHYELEFIDAPALLVDELDNLGDEVLYRRKAYLDSHFDFGGRVSFDEFFSTTTLENQNDNQTEKPLPWKEAQYSFCYPQIDQYRIRTPSSGLTPIHGDYILLKSAGVSGISDHMNNNLYYKYFFYRAAGWEVGATQDPMYDFTRTYGDKSYGGFLYVDASDEARTIAALDFEANLCSGSQLFFTAAISDITTGGNGSIAPQLMIHVYGVDDNGDRSEKPILSFHSGDLRSVARPSTDNTAFKYCKWYQLYGHAAIPNGIDVSQYSKFDVDIDNYSPNTNGADFCVDEIRLYTSTGKVNVKMEGGTCVDEAMTFTANIDVEHLENRITLTTTTKYLYYRIYEKTGEENGLVQYRLYPQNAEDYAAIYGRGDNTWTKSYGKVPIYKYVLTSDGTLDTNYPTQNANYVFQGETLYFDLLENQELKLEQGKTYFIALTKTLDDIQESDLVNDSKWSDPNDVCSIFSNFFVPRKKFVHFLTLDDQTVVSQIIEGVCGQPTLAHKEYIIETQYPDDMVGFKTLPQGTEQSLTDDGVLFDYFLGAEDELKQNYPGYNKKLVDALQEYREFERSHLDICTVYSTELAAGYNGCGSSDEERNTTRTNYAILQDAISKGKLRLRASSHFEDDILYTTTYYAIPVKKNYTFYDEDKEQNVAYELCNYIPFTFTVNGGFNVPDLTLGFDDVDYTVAGRERVIRVGLEQLNKMRTQGYKLHIPVNMYVDKHRQSFKKLYFPQDSYLTISAVDKDADPLVPNTTDPTQPAIGTKFAKIVDFSGGNGRPYVDKSHMYIALDLSGENCAIDFKEGYQYEVATNFFDEDDEALNGNIDAKACIGDLFLMIKVVPEFVTWHSQFVGDDGRTTATNTGYRSANWYNDDNWKRSTRAEMYKDANGNNAQQNTPTEGHPNGYDDNGEGLLSGLVSGSNPGFVPMKFTYVILPSDEPAPSLINEPRVTGNGVGAQNQGGGFLDLTQTTLLTDRSPRDPDGTPDNLRTNSRPTDYIYYDMLVRYSYNANDPYGEGCFGHRKLRDVLVSTDPLTAEQATAYNSVMNPNPAKVAGNVLTPEEVHAYNWDNQGDPMPNAKVFDCEKYQGNVCHDIYFKPGAELLRQQRLTYKRAWVETELYANKWYMLASPLQCTYAGDMYVPPMMTDVATGTTVKGRQVTEAFQPITFSTTARTATSTTTSQPAYSRTLFPIYQRSWGTTLGNGSTNNGKVYVKENDIRATDYSANLKFSSVTTNFAEWGHTFNDVQVPYHTSDNTLAQNLAGFSIRAHKKNQADKVLIRLPKADTSYEYFDWSNTTSDPAAGADIKPVSKPDYNFKFNPEDANDPTLFTVPTSYRLVTDEHHHDGDMEYSVNAMQQNDGYVLVGNPYMVSIDMNKFFTTNSSLDQMGYWTYEVKEENNVVTGEMKAYTKPTQTNTNFVKPMQAFFVKKGTATTITFNKDMQVDGNFPPAPDNNSGARQVAVTLCAANSNGSSSVSLELSDMASADYVGGEDVETLFDSNLSDVPMVYTVAGSRAVSIDNRPSLDIVPFGVSCAASDELVEVSLSGTDVVEGILYIIDAVTGSMTEVRNGCSVMVQPNDYGRYFLTTNGGVTSMKTIGMSGIVVSVRGKLVTVKSDSQLQNVRVLTAGGTVVDEMANCGTEVSFTVNDGVYIVDAETDNDRKTVKVMAK